MLLHIVKKDLVKRKGINIILFIFVTLATVFLSSSVNNILSVTSGVDYYMDYANIPDVEIIMNSDREKEDVEVFLKQEKAKHNIDAYFYQDMVEIADKSVRLENGEFINASGATLFLSSGLKEYNKVFDTQGEPFTLAKGEIAVSTFVAQKNGLAVHNRLHLRLQGKDYEFVISTIMKDAAYGSEMMGMVRFMINEEDYQVLQPYGNIYGSYSVLTSDIQAFKQNVSNQSYTSIINTLDRSIYALLYTFDMILAALLILIGICLILIALLVLRFTLAFTIEEEYQEIGVLKAIGLRNWSIKNIYLMKYFVLVSSGALLGLILSFPISTMMVESISKNMIMESSKQNYIVNIICASLIVIFVLLFCYLCTHKLNKLSAISAIRGGDKGERYHKRRGIALSKYGILPVTWYLGLNDITSSLRRYIVLIITFCISFILITIPLNTVNTMKSKEMVEKFALQSDSTILLNGLEREYEDKFTNTDMLKTGIQRLKTEMSELGYDARISSIPLFFFHYTTAAGDKSVLMTLQPFGDSTDHLTYSEGSQPLLENEIALSKKIVEDYDLQIGDRISIQLKNHVKEMIITGTYSDYLQLGYSVRINAKLDLFDELMFDYNTIMLKYDIDGTQAEVKEKMKALLPAYEWQTIQEYLDKNIGGIQTMIEEMLMPMTGMLCAVIMLITLLMERLFIAREKGEIAMLKSVGFSKRAIRTWQMVRMLWVTGVSMLISIPLSLLSNHFVLKPIFAIMGADVTIQVHAIEAYVLYPVVLFACILLATLFATYYIRNINIKEMNNQE